jgi:arylsulfatase A-like enzyme
VNARLPRPGRGALLAAAAVLVPALVASHALRERAIDRQRLNVLIITVDALSAGHLGAYGYPLDTSPRLDALSREAFLFERAISPSSWTKPSIGGLFTALYPHSHGAVQGSMRNVLPDGVTTLAETLEANSYFNLAVNTNITITASQGFRQGFHIYDDVLLVPAEKAVDRFKRHLEAHRPRRFFGYLHLMDVHTPYRPPEAHRRPFAFPYGGPLDPAVLQPPRPVEAFLANLTDEDRKHVVSLYDACVHHADAEIGALLDWLKARGLLERTIVVVLADHGEELFEHGGFEHGHSLHGEITRVPLLIRHPGFRGGARAGTLVRLIDVYPTLVDFLGLEADASSWAGASFARLFRRPELDLDRAGFSEGMSGERPKDLKALEYRGYKLIRDFKSEGLEFYDLGADPGEARSLPDHPLVREYEGLLDEHLRRGPVHDSSSGGLDAEKLRQLRSLGYL